jgi:hypothetical protein
MERCKGYYEMETPTIIASATSASLPSSITNDDDDG